MRTSPTCKQAISAAIAGAAAPALLVRGAGTAQAVHVSERGGQGNTSDGGDGDKG